MLSRSTLCAFLMLAGCSGDSDQCTLAGCTNGFLIHLVAVEPLRDGTYDLEVTLDGVVTTCRHVIADGQEASAAECNRRFLMHSFTTSYNGGSLPNPDAPNAFVINLSDAAALVTLRAARDGTPLVEQTYEPTYQTIAPNGAECGPICNTAPSQELALSFD